MPSLVLASGSAGRLRVLRDAGFDPEVVVSGVDESNDDDLATAELVTMLAELKATAVASIRPEALVVACDSMLDLDGTAIGKPPSQAEAADTWRRMAGRSGTLYTGQCVIRAGQMAKGVAATTIRFGTPTAAELEAYVATGEPLSLAGSFSIDGRSAPFVEGIDGDPSAVIGLSLPLFRKLLAELGVSVTDLWRS